MSFRQYSTTATAEDAKRLARLAGQYLKKCRLAVELTQSELASKIGMKNYTFISQIENGASRLPPYHYEQVASVMGIDRAVFAKTLLQYYDPFTYRCLFGWPEDPKARVEHKELPDDSKL